MLFAALFIIAFMFGLGIYHVSQQWTWAVAISLLLFVLSTVLDQGASAKARYFSLMFGVPIVFFASLLGCYVVQIRNIDETNEQSND